MCDLEQTDAVSEKYTSYYSNRLHKRGVGEGIYMLTSTFSEPTAKLTDNLPHIEAVFVEVTLPNKKIIVSFF